MVKTADAKKLSIAFLYDDTLDNSDGVAQYVKNLGTWLASQGCEVTYLVGHTKLSSWHRGRVFSLSRNINVRWGGNRLSISLIPKLKLVNRVLQANKFDVVHVQIPYSPFMAQQVIRRLPKDTAVVGTVHVFPAGPLSMLGSKALRLIYGKSLGRIEQVASVSSAAQSYAKEAFKISSVILPNVVDVKRFANKGRRNHPKKVVFLGRLVKRKGCAQLVRAFAGVVGEHPDAQLVIIGKGPERQRLENLVKKLRLANQVEFKGFVTEREKPKLLASASIACFPSLYGESFGIVLLEAMAAGAGVVIGGNNPGYSSVLKVWPAAVFDPRNEKEFSSLLTKLLADQALASKLHAGQQIAVKKCDINLVGKQWLSTYYRVIAKKSLTRHN